MMRKIVLLFKVMFFKLLLVCFRNIESSAQSVIGSSVFTIQLVTATAK